MNHAVCSHILTEFVYRGKVKRRCSICAKATATARRRANGVPAFGSEEYKIRQRDGALGRGLKHGVATFGQRTRAYQSWLAMRNRCRNPKTPDFKFYGARGIAVCRRWNSFVSFLEDMGDPPLGHTLDRRRRNGNYSKSNCRWATRKVQARNRDYCVLTADRAAHIRRLYKPGVTRQVDLASRFGVSQVLISQVLRGVIWA